jgi:hypothetical protein
MVKKATGVSKAVAKKNISFDDYKNCVLDNKDIYCKINAKMTNYSLTQEKLALSNRDDKRVWNGINKRAWGHWKGGREEGSRQPSE